MRARHASSLLRPSRRCLSSQGGKGRGGRGGDGKWSSSFPPPNAPPSAPEAASDPPAEGAQIVHKYLEKIRTAGDASGSGTSRKAPHTLTDAATRFADSEKDDSPLLNEQQSNEKAVPNRVKGYLKKLHQTQRDNTPASLRRSPGGSRAGKNVVPPARDAPRQPFALQSDRFADSDEDASAVVESSSPLRSERAVPNRAMQRFLDGAQKLSEEKTNTIRPVSPNPSSSPRKRGEGRGQGSFSRRPLPFESASRTWTMSPRSSAGDGSYLDADNTTPSPSPRPRPSAGRGQDLQGSFERALVFMPDDVEPPRDESQPLWQREKSFAGKGGRDRRPPSRRAPSEGSTISRRSRPTRLRTGNRRASEDDEEGSFRRDYDDDDELDAWEADADGEMMGSADGFTDEEMTSIFSMVS